MKNTCFSFIFLMLLSLPALGQPSRSDLTEELRTLVQSDEYVEGILDSWSVPTQLREAYREHLELIYATDGFVEYVAGEAFALFANLPEDLLVKQARAFGAALFQEKSALGLKRLAVDEQRFFWETLQKMMIEMPSDECAALVLQTADSLTAGSIEIRALARLSPTVMRRYLAVTRKAILAEIFDDPVYIPMAPTERQIGIQVFEERFVSDLLEHPHSEALMAAAELHDGVPAADTCEFMTLMTSSLLSIDGTAGDWAVRYMTAE